MSISMSTAVSGTGRSGLVPLVAAGILWGTGPLLGALLHRATGLSPVSVAVCRLGVGGLLLLALLALMRRRWPRDRSAWRRIGVVAVIVAVYQCSYFGAVTAVSVSVAALVTIGISPVLVSVLEHLTGRRALDRHRVATIGLALAGLVLLVGVPSDGLAPADLLTGAALSVVAGSAFAALTMVSSRPVPGLDAMTTTGLGFTVGALLLVPLAATTRFTFDPDAGSIVLILALGLVPTALAYVLYFRGLSESGPGTAALLALFEPLTSTLLAALVLGERLAPAGLAGAALLLVALILAGSRSRTVDPV